MLGIFSHRSKGILEPHLVDLMLIQKTMNFFTKPFTKSCASIAFRIWRLTSVSSFYIWCRCKFSFA